jgi:DNA ligase-1
LVLRTNTVDLAAGGEDLEASIAEQAELAREAGVEGIIIKSVDAPYETSGKRVNTWLKLKNMALSGGMRDTLDLVPIGAFYGRGNRTGKFGSFLMASYNQTTNHFESICKLGTGFKYADLDNLQLTPLANCIEK